MQELYKQIKETVEGLGSIQEKISFYNEVSTLLHSISPQKNEPVSNVIWVSSDEVYANDYNPNSVAPPEMELLRLSIESNGYTQPIVAWKTDKGYEVVDGFHRSRVGKEVESVNKRVNGYLPIVVINQDNTDRNDRVAATVRHNRARGKHSVDGMAEIVLDLKRRNWSDKKISKELGMDADEVLRLSQITGLAEMFKDREFSKSWSADTDYEIEPTENIEE
jgi:ParB-like chromosome segregation protein Spo0J